MVFSGIDLRAASAPDLLAAMLPTDREVLESAYFLFNINISARSMRREPQMRIKPRIAL
jgi:hypothetical protein